MASPKIKSGKRPRMDSQKSVLEKKARLSPPHSEKRGTKDSITSPSQKKVTTLEEKKGEGSIRIACLSGERNLPATVKGNGRRPARQESHPTRKKPNLLTHGARKKGKGNTLTRRQARRAQGPTRRRDHYADLHT